MINEIITKRQIKLYIRNCNNSLNLSIPSDIKKKYNLKKGEYLGFKEDEKNIYIYIENVKNCILRKLTDKGNNYLALNIPSTIKKHKVLDKNTILNMTEYKDKIILTRF